MKLTCTWSPEQVSNFATFNCFFWPFPLLPRVPCIDSVQNRLTEARNRREVWRCQSRLTNLWFIIDLLGNATIGNDHFGTLGRPKKKQGSGPNQLPGHRETSRCSQWPVRAWLQKFYIGILQDTYYYRTLTMHWRKNAHLLDQFHMKRDFSTATNTA